MKSITQANELGCGVACVSFLVNKPYNEVIEEVSQINNGLTCKDIIKLLNQYNLKYEYKYIKQKLKKKIYDDGIIVFIARSKDYPYGHYLVRTNNEWMDPWINIKEDSRIDHAESGFRKRLPGRAIYFIYPV